MKILKIKNVNCKIYKSYRTIKNAEHQYRIPAQKYANWQHASSKHKVSYDTRHYFK